jgi:hypothetical protein
MRYYIDNSTPPLTASVRGFPPAIDKVFLNHGLRRVSCLVYPWAKLRLNWYLLFHSKPAAASDTHAIVTEALGMLEGGAAAMLNLVSALDAWLHSPELCGGPLFDAMIEARDQLAEFIPDAATDDE